MITGSLKNKINSIWKDFYNENMAQTSEIVNQPKLGEKIIENCTTSLIRVMAT